MTVAELLSRVSSREFSEWMAYDRLEPFGAERADLRSAIVACTIANVNRSADGGPFNPSDFMPRFDGTGEEPMTKERIYSEIKALYRKLDS